MKIPRIGIGYDSHRFGSVRPLILGGVEIAHDRGLEGHSDADALLHALVDAVLGALGEGNIGTHFPDDDPRWKDARSDVFLERATAIAGERGYRVGNIDAVIVTEAPKIEPHVAAIRENVAKLLQIEPAAVSLKGKSAESLGAIGRKEGLAVHAVALLIPEE